MKLKIDREGLLSRVENNGVSESSLLLENEIKDSVVINTTIEAFRNHYKGDFDNDILSRIKTKNIFELDDARKQAEEIKDIIIDDVEISLNFKDEFIKSLKTLKVKESDKLFIQKLHYELDDDEDLKTIVDALEKSSSDAFYKSYKIIDDKNIAIYSSTNGLWNIEEEEYHFGRIDAEGRRPKTITTVRKLGNPLEKYDDQSKLNFPAYENAKTLLNANAVENIYKSFQNKNDLNVWDDDKVAYFLKPYHLKWELSVEDKAEILSMQAVLEKVKKEGSHIGKATSTTKEANQMIEENKDKIFTNYANITQSAKKVNDIIEDISKAKEESISEFLIRQQEELIEKQKQELEEQKISIIQAKQELPKAIAEFYKAIENGNNIEHALNNISASKYNKFTLQMVMEEVKADILITKQKDNKIVNLEKEKEFYINESKERFEELKNTKEENSKIRGENTQKKIIIEKLENNIKIQHQKAMELFQAFNELKVINDANRVEIFDLKEEVKEYKDEINLKNDEIDTVVDENNSLKAEIEKLKLEKQKLEDENSMLEQSVEEYSKENEVLNEINTNLNENIDKLIKENSDKNSLIKKLEEQVKNVSEENTTIFNKYNELLKSNKILKEKAISSTTGETIDELLNEIKNIEIASPDFSKSKKSTDADVDTDIEDNKQKNNNKNKQ